MPMFGMYVNAPGVKTEYREGDSRVLQLQSKKELGDSHYLWFGIYKVSLRQGCELSSKILPLVVQMNEHDGVRKDRWNDIYSFDNNGVLLSHGFSRMENGVWVADEQHDLDVSRLILHKDNIRQMIGDYPTPIPLITHTTVIDLMNGTLEARASR
jgi:hypothetical protein